MRFGTHGSLQLHRLVMSAEREVRTASEIGPVERGMLFIEAEIYVVRSDALEWLRDGAGRRLRKSRVRLDNGQ